MRRSYLTIGFAVGNQKRPVGTSSVRVSRFATAVFAGFVFVVNPWFFRPQRAL
jgi:hypothetical protein